MNDRHSPESPAPAVPSPDASYAHYPAYGSYGHQDTQVGHAAYGGGDPYFGALPGHQATGAHDAAPYDTTAYDATGYGTDAYATAAYATGAYDGGYDAGAHAAGYDPYSHTAYDTGGYEAAPPAAPAAPDGYEATAVWGVVGQDLIAGIPAQAGPPQTGYPYDADASSQWETMTWAGPALGQYGNEPYETGQHHGASTGPGTRPGNGSDSGTGADTGPYATASDQFASAYGGYEAFPGTDMADNRFASAPEDQHGHPDPFGATAIAEALTQTTPAISPDAFDHPDAFHGIDGLHHVDGSAGPDGPGSTSPDVADITPEGSSAAAAVPAARGSRSRRAAQGGGSSGGSRGRRRTAKRSALLTVAVPSVAAMGVCAVAAASVTSGAESGAKDGTTTQAAGDPGTVQPTAANNKLDTQLASLSAGADDFADRASRTQERIDLKARQIAEKKRKIEEAARKEALRPKFALPVAQHGLSAMYGQAGVNWMSVHTGIDFPVDYGTPVMAATDGTVRTQFNSAYGNMVILTAPDGTETWYCHLSTATVRSGKVKAGEQIAYSGKSGNSTGPHLHFEVRPGGGSPIDPLPWLRNHGLNPT
ncbi:M23 family metallopeptidase [Streptomyces sp. NPDC059788]|uniref:M23 family metallopeptidase n=1 Tax=Streptomyces sp. NPDC059788 TaxID=3346948 RepID=UPI0036629F47